MKIRAILLLLMIGWDASLHWADIFNFWESYPLYITFPLFNFISYNWFWGIFWTFAFLIMLTLLGSSVNIKHTTHVHNYPKEEKELTQGGNE